MRSDPTSSKLVNVQCSRQYGRAARRPAAAAGGQGPTPVAKRRLRWRQSANQSYTREGPDVNKHSTEAFSHEYVGLDVHKETIAVAVADSGTAEPRGLGIIPNDTDALRALVKKLGRPSQLRVCYETGPCGYVIQRFFGRLGIDCVIVAPSLIPRKPGTASRPIVEMPVSWRAYCAVAS
jgi:hypothetical protein